MWTLVRNKSLSFMTCCVFSLLFHGMWRPRTFAKETNKKNKTQVINSRKSVVDECYRVSRCWTVKWFTEIWQPATFWEAKSWSQHTTSSPEIYVPDKYWRWQVLRSLICPFLFYFVLSEGSVLRDPLIVKTPFPHIFDQRVTQTGFVSDTRRHPKCGK